MWQAGGCAHCWVRWGREIVYLGGSRVCYTHLGCFGARGGMGGGCRAYIRSHINQFFPIRQAVPGGLAQAQFCSWARCTWFFIEKKVYCSKYSIFTCNIVFFKCLGRREWMDGTEWVWMTPDDTFLIKQALPVGPRFWFLGSLGSVFHSKICIL